MPLLPLILALSLSTLAEKDLDGISSSSTIFVSVLSSQSIRYGLNSKLQARK
jgi:hypothetical protein